MSWGRSDAFCRTLERTGIEIRPRELEVKK